MAFEMLVGLKIKDAEAYQKYRKAMGPILQYYGGAFRYDFWVGETLLSQTSNPIDRLFTINFPDKQKLESFFSDPDYLEAKRSYFDASVEATTIIAQYEI